MVLGLRERLREEVEFGLQAQEFRLVESQCGESASIKTVLGRNQTATTRREAVGGDANPTA
jgi:hypothetical protein